MRDFFFAGNGLGIDAVAAILFVAFAVIYLIAPALGYLPEGRTRIAIALYVVIAYAGVSLLQGFAFWIGAIEGAGGGDGFLHNLLQVFGFRGRNLGLDLLLLFGLARVILLLTAMAYFVMGLVRLQLRQAYILPPREAGMDNEPGPDAPNPDEPPWQRTRHADDAQT